MNPLSLNTSTPATPLRATAAYAAHARPAGEPASAHAREADRVELSSAARPAADESPVRLDLVRRVRDQLAAGSYETLDKVVIAAEGLRRDVSVLA